MCCVTSSREEFMDILQYVAGSRGLSKALGNDSEIVANLVRAGMESRSETGENCC
jgi:hypothetical protein